MKLNKRVSATVLTLLLQSVEASWAVEFDKQPMAAHQHSIDKRCQPGDQRDAPWIVMATDYPLPWGSPETTGHPAVRVRILEAALDYDVLAVFEGVTPTREEQGVKIYEDGNVSRYRLKGSDGNEFYVNKLAHGWVAHRQFDEYAVSYQFSSACSNLKGMDDSVLVFLQGFLAGGERQRAETK